MKTDENGNKCQGIGLVNVKQYDCYFVNSINDVTVNYKNGKLKPLETYMLYKRILGEMHNNKKEDLLKYRPLQTVTR